MAREINELGLGVKVDRREKLSLLCYADDVVLLAESEEDLQSMLDVVSHWCKQWRLEVNVSKTKVMVFGLEGRKTQRRGAAVGSWKKSRSISTSECGYPKGAGRRPRTSWPGKPGEQERWRGV